MRKGPNAKMKVRPLLYLFKLFRELWTRACLQNLGRYGLYLMMSVHAAFKWEIGVVSAYPQGAAKFCIQLERGAEISRRVAEE